MLGGGGGGENFASQSFYVGKLSPVQIGLSHSRYILDSNYVTAHIFDLNYVSLDLNYVNAYVFDLNFILHI